jgi:glutamine synthetase
MIANTKRLIEVVRANHDKQVGSEIIFTYLEAHTDDSRDVSLDYKLSGSQLSDLPNPTSPATFLPGISPIPGKDISLPKTSCSVFQSTNLDYILRNLNVEQLVVCGQLTDQCIESAVRDAADLGYFVTVVEDACGAKSNDSHLKGLFGMKGFARILSTDQVLRELRDISDVSCIASQCLSEIGNVTIVEPPACSEEFTFSIPKPSEYSKKKDNGYQAAILRSLRAAGIKFLRYTVVDAFNTIRCKSVPLPHALSLLPNRTLRNSNDSSRDPLENPVSVAEICFAGLPPHADVPVPQSNLSARNVLSLQPDFSSLRILPYAPRTAMVMCTAHNQQTNELSPLCTRGLLERILFAARECALQFCIGAEIEFQLFHCETKEPVDSSTFANSIPLNEQEDFISMLYEQLSQQDIPIELLHAESAPGQFEVVLRYSTDVMQLADDIVLSRETIAACAKTHGYKALFLPKTSMTSAGNGLHLHFSFRDVESSLDNTFSDPSRPTGISLKGESFIEGILTHLPSLLCFSLPTPNSFRRVGPGCWTGSVVGWSTEDKESAIRVCLDLCTKNVTNVEYKLSDSTANIYLELAMIIAAGLDGISKRRVLRPEADAASESLPTSLAESLGQLKANDLLISLLGPELMTAYVAVRESMLLTEKTFEEEVIDAFNKA